MATRCPHGPEEIVADGQTGLLVPTGDPQALGEALEAMLDDEATRTRMAVAAYERARERYGAPALARAWERLISA